VVTVRRRGRRCRGSRKVGEAVRGGLGGEWPKPLVAAGVRRQAVRLPTLPSLPLQAVNRPRLVARSQVDSQPETVAKPRRDWGWPHRYSPNNLGCPVKLASTHRGTWSSRLFPSMRTSPEAVMRVSHPRAPKNGSRRGGGRSCEESPPVRTLLRLPVAVVKVRAGLVDEGSALGR